MPLHAHASVLIPGHRYMRIVLCHGYEIRCPTIYVWVVAYTGYGRIFSCGVVVVTTTCV